MSIKTGSTSTAAMSSPLSRSTCSVAARLLNGNTAVAELAGVEPPGAGDRARTLGRAPQVGRRPGRDIHRGGPAVIRAFRLGEVRSASCRPAMSRQWRIASVPVLEKRTMPGSGMSDRRASAA